MRDASTESFIYSLNTHASYYIERALRILAI